MSDKALAPTVTQKLEQVSDVQQLQQQHSTSEQSTHSSSHAKLATLHIDEGNSPESLLFETSKL